MKVVNIYHNLDLADLTDEHQQKIFKLKQWQGNTLGPLSSWECMEYIICQLFTSTRHLLQQTR